MILVLSKATIVIALSSPFLYDNYIHCCRLNEKREEAKSNRKESQSLSLSGPVRVSAGKRGVRGILHCTENSKQKHPEMKLRGLVPNFDIYVSVSYLYFPAIGLPLLLM